MKDFFMQLGSAVAGLMVMATLFRDHFPANLRSYLERHTYKLARLVYPYVEIVFPEFTGERLMRSHAFTAIQNYLTATATNGAKRLKADILKGSQSVLLSMDDNEEVTDNFNGVKLWWRSNKTSHRNMSFSFYPTSDERRFYKLTFHKRHRELITEEYVKHILSHGKEIESKNRQRKLYLNNPSESWHRYMQSKWSHVAFEHPASFETLAMETKKKEEIMKDLKKFAEGKEYYAKVGKAWKRGYLLYGPPGTGKSTMVAAMANFMNYDIYDLELTSVKDNTELKKLLIETSSKSIIVIEDIDCSLDLTGQRKKKEDDNNDDDKDNEVNSAKKKAKKDADKPSKVTLSGLLNFIDGLWSSCGGERIIIFTTNYIDKLDPALIRRGRMDKHIEMSYCSFEAFEVLAKNYLDIDSHPLYPKIKQLLGETNMIPADVVEHLMFKSDEENVETCLNDLFEALETAKEEARKKAEEEAAKKAMEEEAAKKAMEEEAAKKAMEEEAAKKAMEEEAAKKAMGEEAAKKAMEEEAAKKAMEEEADITARTEVQDSANPASKLKANGTANGDLKEK